MILQPGASLGVYEPDQQARFAREARALAALNHPHIAAIDGFESIGDTQLLVMELVEGYTLADRLDSGPREAEQRHCGAAPTRST